METSAGHNLNFDVAASAEDVASKAVDLFLSEAAKSIEERGVFKVAISGGHTPKRFFELLGELPENKSPSWQRVHIFWVDERYVPPESEWSNYKLAADTFLKKISMPVDNVHRIPTEYSDFQESARQYEEAIREVFGTKRGRIPQFDLIILGIGREGHTGSLFPGSFAQLDTEDLACVVYVLDEEKNRITLTSPVLCAARRLVVLACGEEKSDILKEVFMSDPDDVRYPIHVLWPVLEKVTWLLDAGAAKLIARSD